MPLQPSSACLAPECIDAFVAGKLDAAALAGVDEHVAHCEACSRRVVHAAWQLVPEPSETLHAAGVLSASEAASLPSLALSQRLAELLRSRQAAGSARAAAPSAPAPLLGGRFELGALLAEGAMGAVYHGVDRQTGRRVAIKRLKPEVAAANPDLLTRFRLEAEVLSRLDHPNIVKLEATLLESDERYIVMEHVAGGSLRDRLRAEHKLPLSRALLIVLELCDALSRAHHLRIIHRDIKPENILMAEDGTPRLTDFGLARVQGGQRLTERGEIMGTVAYLSPEALWGRALDERADVWALGVVLYEMARGEHPFWSDSPAATLTAILQQPLPDLESAWPDAPIALVDLLYRMLEKDPEQRIPSMRRVGAEIEAIARDLDSGVSSRRPPGSRPATSARSGPRVSALPSSDALPAAATPFVGRDEELRELHALLAAPDTRLVSVLGPGGMGKSRLALHAARSFAAARGAASGEAPSVFPDGVHFVDLGALRSAELFVSAIADAVGYRFYPGVEPWRQLLDFFREKRLLLLLDNFENVLEAARLVGELLEVAPWVKALATSRQSLGLRAETQFVLGGLPVPPAGAAAVNLDEAHGSALFLFEQTARRSRRSFELDAETLPHAAAICRLVQGLPLGIVLSASWVGMLSVAEIEQEIRQSLDFLRTDLADVPERQRSLRAVFDHSVRLLGAEARGVFVRIGVFQGGFTRAAAEAVAGASLRTLSELIDKSLIVREPQSGRYRVHDLLRQYAAEQLGADAAALARVCAKHAEYQVQFLCERQAALQGVRQRVALREIEADLDNVRSGWHWLVEQGHFAALGRALEPLAIFYQRHSVAEGRAACAALVDAAWAKSSEPDTELRRVIGLALAWQGFFSAEQGQHPEGHRLLQRALSLLDEQAHPREAAFACVTAAFSFRGTAGPEETMALAARGLSLYRRTDDHFGLARALVLGARASLHVLGDTAGAEAQYREAVALQKSFGDRAVVLPLALAGLGQARMLSGHQRESLELISEGLAIAERFDDPWSVLSCLNALALTERSLGQYEAAEAAARRALGIAREFGASRAEAWGALMLGDALKEQGRLDEAIGVYETALVRGTGDVVIQASVDLELGNIALSRGLYAQARERLSASLMTFERSRNNWGMIIALDGLGSLACAEGDLASSEVYFRRALALGSSSGMAPLMFNALAGFARAKERAGELERAVTLAAFLAQHPATEHATRVRRVEPLLGELRRALAPGEFAAAVERGRSLPLEASLWA